MHIREDNRWKFIDGIGTFEWKRPAPANELYFPICNEAGMMASITPHLHGDAATGWHTFLRRPLVMEDLHNTRSTRNFWLFVERLGPFSVTGRSARQLADSFGEDERIETTIRGTFLTHSLERVDSVHGVRACITSFCPVNDDKVEIHHIQITNIGEQDLELVPTTSFPIYGRSADNLRDHNHWTSLSHRVQLNSYGLVVTPEMQHDEAGHRPNHSSYFVLAIAGDGELPVGQFPTIRDFIGEGNLDWPEAVVLNRSPQEMPHARRDGMEAIGAVRFSQRLLRPGDSCEYVVVEGVTEDKASIQRCIERYGSSAKVGIALRQNKEFWKERVERIRFETSDPRFDLWMHWVGLQPILRKIYGNSFLPHFDYGRGGRGWRDLWQDCLALLLQNPDEMRDSLVSYFDGVRIDGSNATIINQARGEFVADRNRISRVWMDHGVWPYFTLRLYINQTGDLDVIAAERSYWQDHQIYRAKGRDTEWKESDGTLLKDGTGSVYYGTVLEHILVQHLTCFCNVGEHNIMKLEDADWNDLMDMANERGETVPFSAFYGHNLIDIADLLEQYSQARNRSTVLLCADLVHLTGIDEPLESDSPEAKRRRLQEYFAAVHQNFSGKRRDVPIDRLIFELRRMGQWVLDHVRSKEWVESCSGHGFFNGYYNNDGKRVDGDDTDGPRMNLTAQTFAILSGAASDEQVRRSYSSICAILRDPRTGGFRLTTPLGENRWNLGRGFAVVYGEKEMGGAFNHMIVMLLNGLYRRGFVREAYQVLTSVYRLANDTPHAKIYPGIPEYINSEGQGKYHYLSGSASWLLMTLLTEVFGVRGQFGDLVLHPKLVREQFDSKGHATTYAHFRSRRIVLTYENSGHLDFGEYVIGKVLVNGTAIEEVDRQGGRVRFAKEVLDRTFSEHQNRIQIQLQSK